MSLTPSPQQQLILDWVAAGSGHGSIHARAGAGKTSTLAMLASRIPPAGNKVVALSFSKEAATQLGTKLPFFVESSTFHSYWFKSLRRHFGGRIQVDDKKSQWALKDLVPDWKDRSEIQSAVLRLVSYAKAAGYGCEGASCPPLEELGLHYGLDVTERISALAASVLERAASETNRIDFDDMLWLSLRHKVCPDKSTWLLVDEAQDTNVVQRLLLPRMLGPTGRLVIVGDEYQAIYGFRGAGHDSMSQIESDFSMQRFDLSVSYRCSKAVVAEARKYLSRPLTPHFTTNEIADAEERWKYETL